MHPARHRALRELGALCSQLAEHWETLAGRVAGTGAESALLEGATSARGILAEATRLAAERDLTIGPAAVKLAGRVARARPPVADALLERNQALRFAVLDAQHVLTLVDYLAQLSGSDSDPEMRAACASWNGDLRAAERAVRRAAVDLGRDPDAAIEPISPGARITYAVGWLGEAVDRLTNRRGD